MQIHLLNSDRRLQPSRHHFAQLHHQNHLQTDQRTRQRLSQIGQLARHQRPAAAAATTMTNPHAPKSATSSASPASSRAVLLSLALLVLFACTAQAKPLNQNQVRFRRVPPKEFSAALGSSITIECEAGASPPPTIHWLKDGKRIVQNELDENQLDDEASGQAIQVDDVSRIALSTSRARLYIDCADFADEATYTCVAENAYSRVSSHTRLNLIKPLVQPAAGGNENDLGADESASPSALSAVPQCLSERARAQTPARIHMWTHNIVEIMKNNVVLLCRSNVKRAAPLQELNLLGNSNGKQAEPASPPTQSNSNKPLITWTLPNDKLVSEDQKDKYEVLETGDLLIKDLNWSDMGSYVCTAADEQSSDSVSSFVYPASVKASSSKRAAAAETSSSTRLTRFT